MSLAHWIKRFSAQLIGFAHSGTKEGACAGMRARHRSVEAPGMAPLRGDFLNQGNINGEMIAVAADVGAEAVGTEWVTAELAGALDHVGAAKNVGFVEAVAGGIRGDQVIGEDDLVEETPGIAVGTGANALFEIFEIWVVQVAVTELLGLRLCAKHAFDAGTDRVIVKVSHNQYPGRWVSGAQGVGEVAAEGSTGIA